MHTLISALALAWIGSTPSPEGGSTWPEGNQPLSVATSPAQDAGEAQRDPGPGLVEWGASETGTDPLESALARGTAAVSTSKPELEYLSDFLCFVGQDAVGRVLLAVDLNRGRKDKRFEGEQFIALYVDGEAWLEVGGQQELAVDSLQALPNSQRWSVEGSRQDGYTVACSDRDLTLTTEHLEAVGINRRDQDLFSTGFGKGELRLGQRVISGFVHHEFCFLKGINPLAKTYTDLFGDGFHGLYCVVGSGEGMEPLRMHRSGGTLESLIQQQNGFEHCAAGSTRLDSGNFRISDWSLGGFFRWPGRYRLDWSCPVPSGPAAAPEGQMRTNLSFEVSVKERKTVINYVFGGVAVALVEGSSQLDGVQKPIFGLALIVR